MKVKHFYAMSINQSYELKICFGVRFNFKLVKLGNWRFAFGLRKLGIQSKLDKLGQFGKHDTQKTQHSATTLGKHRKFRKLETMCKLWKLG